MNDQKRERPTGSTGMSSREVAESIRRIEDDLYYSSDNIKIRLTRIEEKLEHVATRDDLKAFVTRDDLKAFATREDLKAFATREDLGVLRIDMERMRTDMLAHSNTQFRWTIGVVVSCMGIILTVMKLT
ncbi:MAG: hypothetical protein F4Z81_02135 [Gemmatimonadetes bacterium]|nr:hypothetical protein [Gemmatimonadota bacterium]MYB62474.1 hypothetical protein [Gemmatimonadota bacterium]